MGDFNVNSLDGSAESILPPRRRGVVDAALRGGFVGETARAGAFLVIALDAGAMRGVGGAA